MNFSCTHGTYNVVHSRYFNILEYGADSGFVVPTDLKKRKLAKFIRENLSE